MKTSSGNYSNRGRRGRYNYEISIDEKIKNFLSESKARQESLENHIYYKSKSELKREKKRAQKLRNTKRILMQMQDTDD